MWLLRWLGIEDQDYEKERRETRELQRWPRLKDFNFVKLQSCFVDANSRRFGFVLKDFRFPLTRMRGHEYEKFPLALPCEVETQVSLESKQVRQQVVVFALHGRLSSSRSATQMREQLSMLVARHKEKPVMASFKTVKLVRANRRKLTWLVTGLLFPETQPRETPMDLSTRMTTQGLVCLK
jgi:hypothetical protein